MRMIRTRQTASKVRNVTLHHTFMLTCHLELKDQRTKDKKNAALQLIYWRRIFSLALLAIVIVNM